jgi:hypothetical protein
VAVNTGAAGMPSFRAASSLSANARHDSPKLFPPGEVPETAHCISTAKYSVRGLSLCVFGLWIASKAGARFTGNHFLSAWSEKLLAVGGLFLLVGSLLYLIAANRLREGLENMSPEQDAAFERTSSQAAVYVLGGILLLTTVLSSIRA